VIRPLSFWFAAAAVSSVALTVLAAACGAQQEVASGGECFTSLDCAPGLACVPKGSTSTCTSNTSSIQTEIDAGVDAPNVGDTGPVILADGSLKGPDSTTPGTDATIPIDTGAPPIDSGHDTAKPPVDAGHPIDTGAPKDTAPPPKDTAPPPEDAGHPVDASHPPSDAATE